MRRGVSYRTGLGVNGSLSLCLRGGTRTERGGGGGGAGGGATGPDFPRLGPGAPLAAARRRRVYEAGHTSREPGPPWVYSVALEAVLNQGDQSGSKRGNLIPPSLILIPDVPDVPAVPSVGTQPEWGLTRVHTRTP